jgi:ankyrin repeat protein
LQKVDGIVGECFKGEDANSDCGHFTLSLLISFATISRDENEGGSVTVMSHKKIAALFVVFLMALMLNVKSVAHAQDQETARRESSQVTPDPKDENGRTALMRAALSGNRAEVQALLDSGADVNATTERGVTALMLAAGKGRTEIVQDLLTKGADVNAKTPGNYTALMSAALNGQIEIVKVLLDKGADANAKDNGDQTAMKYAESKGHTDVVELLTRAKNKE